MSNTENRPISLAPISSGQYAVPAESARSVRFSPLGSSRTVYRILPASLILAVPMLAGSVALFTRSVTRQPTPALIEFVAAFALFLCGIALLDLLLHGTREKALSPGQPALIASFLACLVILLLGLLARRPRGCNSFPECLHLLWNTPASFFASRFATASLAWAGAVWVGVVVEECVFRRWLPNELYRLSTAGGIRASVTAGIGVAIGSQVAFMLSHAFTSLAFASHRTFSLAEATMQTMFGLGLYLLAVSTEGISIPITMHWIYNWSVLRPSAFAAFSYNRKSALLVVAAAIAIGYLWAWRRSGFPVVRRIR